MLLGPVLVNEWRSACKPRRHLRIRTLYALIVSGELALFFVGWLADWFFTLRPGLHAEQVGVRLAWEYFEFFAAQHFLVVVLITPALAAGSISDEKARGTLALALTTELSATDLIVGKWLAHVAQVLLLALPAFPVLLFTALLGGLTLGTVAAGTAETVLLTGVLAAAALLASVWARKTTNAVLAVYAVGGALALGTWTAGYGSLFEQLSVMAVRNELAGRSWWRAGWLGLIGTLAAVSVTCLALAAWRLRPALARQLTATRRAGRWLPWMNRPAVTDAPMRWKERYVGELGLLSFVRFVPRWLLLAGVAALGFGVAYLVRDDDWAVFVHGLLLMLVVAVLAAVRASGSISGERERQTWEGLLLTPAEPYTLVRGKLWGIHDGVRPYLIAYFVPAVAVSLAGGFWPTFCLAVCWLLSWWLMYYFAAQGLLWSARLSSSWQSLTFTLASAAYTVFFRAVIAVWPVGVVLFAGTAAVGSCLAPARLFSTPVAWYLMILVYLVTPTVVSVFSFAEEQLQEAERQIAITERTIQARTPRRAGAPPVPHVVAGKVG